MRGLLGLAQKKIQNLTKKLSHLYSKMLGAYAKAINKVNREADGLILILILFKMASEQGSLSVFYRKKEKVADFYNQKKFQFWAEIALRKRAWRIWENT